VVRLGMPDASAMRSLGDSENEWIRPVAVEFGRYQC
jgi:hypothetical protein